MTASEFHQILKQVLKEEYGDAQDARLKYSVLKGKSSYRALIDLEHAFSHVICAYTKEDPTEIDHIKSHLQRIATELTEQVAEDTLLSIRTKIDPYFRHPLLSKLMLIPYKAVAFAEHGKELAKIQSLIYQGRHLKGTAKTYRKCYNCFKEAANRAEELDQKIPPSQFYSSFFTILVSIIVGTVFFVLGILTN